MVAARAERLGIQEGLTFEPWTERAKPEEVEDILIAKIAIMNLEKIKRRLKASRGNDGEARLEVARARAEVRWWRPVLNRLRKRCERRMFMRQMAARLFYASVT